MSKKNNKNAYKKNIYKLCVAIAILAIGTVFGIGISGNKYNNNNDNVNEDYEDENEKKQCLKLKSNTKWECKYHVVFAPKHRRQVIYRSQRLAL